MLKNNLLMTLVKEGKSASSQGWLLWWGFVVGARDWAQHRLQHEQGGSMDGKLIRGSIRGGDRGVLAKLT